MRRVDKSQRVRDMIVLGIAVGLAAGAAQVIQLALRELIDGELRSFSGVPVVALAGFACGAVIGFKVPWACRTNLVTPLDPIMARALRDLLRQAQVALGAQGAEDWVFMPHTDLGGVTPAEAVQYKTHATGVGRLLENEACRRREDASPDRSDRPAPVVIEGGRSADAPTSSLAYGH